MKRLLGGYIMMVGIPFLIILLVLNAGGELTAPASIDGAWIMQPASPETAKSCVAALPELVGGSLVISQSGRHLSARWNQGSASSMNGTLDQGRFILCSLGHTNEQCATDPLHLNGRVLEENGARRIEVRLAPDSVEGCGELVLLSAWRTIKSDDRMARGYNY